MPQALALPLHCARAEPDFVKAVEASIVTGGCTASRASLAGACYGALVTDEGLPKDWISSLALGERIQHLLEQLSQFREKRFGPTSKQ